jgi:hypothetical protein
MTVTDAMVQAFAVAEQRVYNEAPDMDTTAYERAVRAGLEAALAVQNETPLAAETGNSAAESAPIVDSEKYERYLEWLHSQQ